MIEDPVIQQRMDAIGIGESDLRERFVKGSGPGGQKINKTASCVFLKHLPTGIEIKCQEGRSLTANRLEARRRLCQALERQMHEHQRATARQRAKIRFQKRRRSQRQKQKIVADKRCRGKIKRLRRRPSAED